MFLALAQRLLRPLALADVRGNRAHANNAATMIQDRELGINERTRRTVGQFDFMLPLNHIARFYYLPFLGGETFGNAAGKQLFDRHTDHFLFRTAMLRGSELIGKLIWVQISARLSDDLLRRITASFSKYTIYQGVAPIQVF